MERLTERNEDGNVLIKQKDGSKKCDFSKENDRLAEYEETGYTPEEVIYTKEALETEILYSEYWKARALEALQMIQKLKEKNESLLKGSHHGSSIE